LPKNLPDFSKFPKNSHKKTVSSICSCSAYRPETQANPAFSRYYIAFTLYAPKNILIKYCLNKSRYYLKHEREISGGDGPPLYFFLAQQIPRNLKYFLMPFQIFKKQSKFFFICVSMKNHQHHKKNYLANKKDQEHLLTCFLKTGI
jgi:hypothetical protein